jgi:hypothetical protein
MKAEQMKKHLEIIEQKLKRDKNNQSTAEKAVDLDNDEIERVKSHMKKKQQAAKDALK